MRIKSEAEDNEESPLQIVRRLKRNCKLLSLADLGSNGALRHMINDIFDLVR